MDFLFSYIRSSGVPQKIKIEAKLNRGLPKVSVLGLSDSASKENLTRVKSAIQNQGFDWRIDKHMILSLEGVLKKQESDTLLDLALAVSILRLTGQLNIKTDQEMVLLGGLDLNGFLSEFDLSKNGFVPKEGELWLGNFKQSEKNCLKLEKLSDLNNLKQEAHVKDKGEKNISAQLFSDKVKYLAPDWRELFEIAVHGEHSLLFLMPEAPDLIEFIKLVRENLNSLHPDFRSGVRFEKNNLRPFVSVNMSATRNQILGQGGNQKGLYYFAHGGVAYLDQFFSHAKPVKDAVKTLVFGGGFMEEKNLNTQLVARSPLCPCGKAKVGVPRKCSFSLYKCRALIEKLSVDELSMFQLIVAPQTSWCELYTHPDLDLEVMNQRRQLAFDVQAHRKQKISNAKLSLFDLQDMMSENCKALAYFPKIEGLDRTRALLSVARTVADLEGAIEIEAEHIDKAKHYSFKVAKEVLKTF
jgi:magnesium chelatase family protein